jgi:hypothetical protein
MMNPGYFLTRVRDGITRDYEPSRERSLVLTKLDEAELWLSRCEPTAEALTRDQQAAP